MYPYDFVLNPIAYCKKFQINMIRFSVSLRIREKPKLKDRLFFLLAEKKNAFKRVLFKSKVKNQQSCVTNRNSHKVELNAGNYREGFISTDKAKLPSLIFKTSCVIKRFYSFD